MCLKISFLKRNLEIKECRNLGMRRSGNMEVEKYRYLVNVEIRKRGKPGM